MKLLDFFNAEQACCSTCRWGGGNPPITACVWENTYPEEYQFAVDNKWISYRAPNTIAYCRLRTQAGRDFYKQLTGDYT